MLFRINLFPSQSHSVKSERIENLHEKHLQLLTTFSISHTAIDCRRQRQCASYRTASPSVIDTIERTSARKPALVFFPREEQTSELDWETAAAAAVVWIEYHSPFRAKRRWEPTRKNPTAHHAFGCKYRYCYRCNCHHRRRHSQQHQQQQRQQGEALLHHFAGRFGNPRNSSCSWSRSRNHQWPEQQQRGSDSGWQPNGFGEQQQQWKRCQIEGECCVCRRRRSRAVQSAQAAAGDHRAQDSEPGEAQGQCLGKCRKGSLYRQHGPPFLFSFLRVALFRFARTPCPLPTPWPKFSGLADFSRRHVF